VAASARTIAVAVPDLTERYAEDASALWLLRRHATRAPNGRLTNLVRLDERLEAHLSALRVAGEAGWAAVKAELEAGVVGALFVAVSLAVSSGVVDRFDAIDLAADHRAAISALAWAERAAATPFIDRLAGASDPRHRAMAIAALGARRSIDADLARALADPSPLVRASACRTAGQLGRAELIAQLGQGDDDPECRFWSAWAAARMGSSEPLDTLADIAWSNLPRAERALDLLLRRLDLPQANDWLREFAKLPDRQRSLIRAAGLAGDPRYIAWLIERMAEPPVARVAGEAFSMITGVDLAYRDLDRRAPAEFQSGPTDDPEDENVALDADEHLPWPDPERIGRWWTANRSRLSVGKPHFLGVAKAAADWLDGLSNAFQHQRHAAALELAIRQPDRVMFEVRARGRLQRRLLARGAPAHGE
jgi:uncharacterized protein (TIGR02270 family)